MKTRFDHAFVLNVMADDHPGIVAAVSQDIVELGGNIDACSQTVLSGYFTLIMIVSFPRELALADLRRQVIGPARQHTGFQVEVRPYEPEKLPKPLPDAENFVITAFGPDREGIILRFSRFLADKGINIVDLFGNRQDNRFVLVGQVQVPRRWDIAMLQTDLEHLAAEAGYTVRLQHENVFVATNQLRLTHAVGWRQAGREREPARADRRE